MDDACQWCHEGTTKKNSSLKETLLHSLNLTSFVSFRFVSFSFLLFSFFLSPFLSFQGGRHRHVANGVRGAVGDQHREQHGDNLRGLGRVQEHSVDDAHRALPLLRARHFHAPVSFRGHHRRRAAVYKHPGALLDWLVGSLIVNERESEWASEW